MLNFVYPTGNKDRIAVDRRDPNVPIAMLTKSSRGWTFTHFNGVRITTEEMFTIFLYMREKDREELAV